MSTSNPYQVAPGLFAFDYRVPRISVQAQQLRALHLASMSGAELDGSRVAVVGAGVGGLTFAVAAALQGAHEVHIFERGQGVMGNLRFATHRHIHPNMADWPRPGWDAAVALSPILRWHAMRADRLWERLHHAWQQWLRVLPALRKPALLKTVKRLEQQGAKWRVHFFGTRHKTSADSLDYDIVVLMPGPGEERHVDLGRPKDRRYWDPDGRSLDREAGQRQVWVSGNGDGGMIDVIRAALFDSTAAKPVSQNDLLRWAPMLPAGQDWRTFQPTSRHLAEVDAFIQRSQNHQNRVVWFGKLDEGRANPLHELFVKRLIAKGIVEHRNEHCPVERIDANVDQAILRNGLLPDHPTVRLLKSAGLTLNPAGRPPLESLRSWAEDQIEDGWSFLCPPQGARCRVPEQLIWDRSEWHTRAGDHWFTLDRLVRRHSVQIDYQNVSTAAKEIASRWENLQPETLALGERGRASLGDLAEAYSRVTRALSLVVPLGAAAMVLDGFGRSESGRIWRRWLEDIAVDGRALCSERRGVMLPPRPGSMQPIVMPNARREQVRYSVAAFPLDPDTPAVEVDLDPINDAHLDVVDVVCASRSSVRAIRLVRVNQDRSCWTDTLVIESNVVRLCRGDRLRWPQHDPYTPNPATSDHVAVALAKPCCLPSALANRPHVPDLREFEVVDGKAIIQLDWLVDCVGWDKELRNLLQASRA